jgi:hypothetical protein
MRKEEMLEASKGRSWKQPVVVMKVAWWLKEEDERDKRGVSRGRKENIEKIVVIRWYSPHYKSL